jgi:L-alanine-DL-glutamate epimerase-like enolase superfamily enzyme
MKITGIDITRHRLILDPPFRASWDSRPRTHFDATIARVHTDEGLCGIGSGDLMLGFEGHEDLFLGEDPLRLERHFQVLSNIAFHYGRCWPLDLALWDLAGKIAGQPVWKLLGGRADRLPAYASSGVLRDGAETADVAEQLIERGFRAMKIRFHRGDWRDDIAILAAVRKRVGARLELMVDCNQGWRMPWDTAAPWTFRDALNVARELENLGIYWMEEPLHRGDREGMRRLRDRVDIRIAAGEMTRELYEFRDLVIAGAVDVLQPDAALTGGITGLRRVAVMAEDHGVIFTPHTWTNGVGLIANAHLAAGMTPAPFIEFPHDPPEWSAARRDFMLRQPVEVDPNGDLVLRDVPGLGIELDEARLAETQLG